MRRRRQGGFGVLLLLLSGGMGLFLAGCGGSASSGPEVKRIIILTNGNSPFWDAAAAGAKQAENDLNLTDAKLQVVIDRNNFEVEAQVSKLKQYGNSTDVVAVGISVTDAKNVAIADEMRKLRKQGIHVVTIDSDVNRETASDARVAYLGTDNIVAGRQLGIAARGLMPDGAKYATFVGLKEAANAIERINGFAEGAGEGFQQVENLGDGGDASPARKNVRDALNRNEDLNLLVGIWSYNTPAIIDIVKELGIRDKTKVIGFDADPPAIGGMKAGLVDAIVVQNPYQMGYQGVRMLKALIDDNKGTISEILPELETKGADIYDTGLKVVVPNEGSPLTGDMFEENVEFLTLSEFQTWLDKFHLTGS